MLWRDEKAEAAKMSWGFMGWTWEVKTSLANTDSSEKVEVREKDGARAIIYI